MRKFLIFQYKIWCAKTRQKTKAALKKQKQKQGSTLCHSGPELTKSSPGCYQTPSNSPASVSEVLGLQVCATMVS